MKRGGVWLGAVIVLLLFAFGVRTQTGLPPNPHAFLDDPDACLECHDVYLEEPDPHEFIEPISPKCMVQGCHPPEQLGRSHPVGVDPRFPDDPTVESFVPDELPLEDGLVSCGTCHNPHMEYLSTEQIHKKQNSFFILMEGENEIPYYKTYFARMSDSDPETGHERLCQQCHKNY